MRIKTGPNIKTENTPISPQAGDKKNNPTEGNLNGTSVKKTIWEKAKKQVGKKWYAIFHPSKESKNAKQATEVKKYVPSQLSNYDAPHFHALQTELINKAGSNDTWYTANNSRMIFPTLMVNLENSKKLTTVPEKIEAYGLDRSKLCAERVTSKNEEITNSLRTTISAYQSIANLPQKQDTCFSKLAEMADLILTGQPIKHVPYVPFTSLADQQGYEQLSKEQQQPGSKESKAVAAYCEKAHNIFQKAVDIYLSPAKSLEVKKQELDTMLQKMHATRETFV